MKEHIKYPRTFHLPWSPGASSDDKILKDVSHFSGREVVVTEKMDGENTTMYRDGFHARSLNSRGHESRDWMAAFHATVANDIPEGWRLCGENLYARHSLSYDSLPSYFMGFSLWNGDNEALSWDETVEYFSMMGISPVKVLWRGIFDEEALRELAASLDLQKQEGYVVRVAEGFKFEDFSKSVAKFVRKGHVQTDDHWRHQKVVPNKLGGN